MYRKKTDFHTLISHSATMLNSFISSNGLWEAPQDFITTKSCHLWNCKQFYFFHSNLDAFFIFLTSFSWLEVLEQCQLKVKEADIPVCLVFPTLGENGLLPISMTFAVGFSQILFVKLRKFPSICSLLIQHTFNYLLDVYIPCWTVSLGMSLVAISLACSKKPGIKEPLNNSFPND